MQRPDAAAIQKMNDAKLMQKFKDDKQMQADIQKGTNGLGIKKFIEQKVWIAKPAPPQRFYLDINVFVPIWPLPLEAGFGITGGVQIDFGTGGVHPYIGAGVGTVGGSVTVAPGQNVTPGMQWGVGGFGNSNLGIGGGSQFGGQIIGPGGGFWELGLGAPGGSATIYWVFPSIN